LHWTLAGSGVVHDEVPIEPGKEAHGLQLFVNLAAKDKFMPPAVIRNAAANRPTFRQAGGASVKVAFGEYDDGVVRHAPAVALPTRAALFDVRLQTGQTFRYPVPPGDNAFFLVVAGTVTAGGNQYAEGKGAAYARDGQVAEIIADSAMHGEAQVAFFTGTPLNEPVVQHGPFAMSTAEDIAKVMADYQAGRMGRLEALA
jgi:redox-sensitive bicupin YhaK (pirin superfamily)